MAVNAVAKTFCTTREAADLLGVSVGTVQLWVERGILEAWKTDGGHRRVVRESIEKLLHKPGAAATATASAGAPGLAALGPSAEAAPVLKVMVVEDDPNLLRLYQAQISRWPHKLQWQGLDNGFAALLALGRSRPDLLILDLHLPEMDGFGMLRMLYKTPELASTRVVVVTGMDSAGIASRGGLPPDVEVLQKPIPFDRLRAIADEVVAQMQPGRAAAP